MDAQIILVDFDADGFSQRLRELRGSLNKSEAARKADIGISDWNRYETENKEERTEPTTTKLLRIAVAFGEDPLWLWTGRRCSGIEDKRTIIKNELEPFQIRIKTIWEMLSENLVAFNDYLGEISEIPHPTPRKQKTAKTNPPQHEIEDISSQIDQHISNLISEVFEKANVGTKQDLVIHLKLVLKVKVEGK